MEKRKNECPCSSCTDIPCQRAYEACRKAGNVGTWYQGKACDSYWQWESQVSSGGVKAHKSE